MIYERQMPQTRPCMTMMPELVSHIEGCSTLFDGQAQWIEQSKPDKNSLLLLHSIDGSVLNRFRHMTGL